MNAVNGKPMARLLAKIRKNTAYLRHFVKVVELWECEWKEMRRDPAVKKCLDAEFPRRRHARWTMTLQQILSGMSAGTVFGMIECDICVPEELRLEVTHVYQVIEYDAIPWRFGDAVSTSNREGFQAVSRKHHYQWKT